MLPTFLPLLLWLVFKFCCCLSLIWVAAIGLFPLIRFFLPSSLFFLVFFSVFYILEVQFLQWLANFLALLHQEVTMHHSGWNFYFFCPSITGSNSRHIGQATDYICGNLFNLFVRNLYVQILFVEITTFPYEYTI